MELAMKTEEDEAFDELARKQGDWGGGFPAKRQMAADKFIAAEESKVGERYGYVPKLHPSEWMDSPMAADKLQKPWNEDEWRKNNWRCQHGWLRGEQCEICNASPAPKPAQEPVKCAVRDCQNHMHQGQFVGSVCLPCYINPPLPAQEPASYLHTVINAFGPDEGISLDQKGWSQLHAALKAVLAQPAQEPVARVTGVYGGRFTYDPINPAMVLPVGMALYSAPKGNT
jgi:hypothetical protein